METVDSILQFWFGADGSATEIAGRQSQLWWAKSEAQDQEIRRRFGASLDLAAQGELDEWSTTPGGLLALVLLTDQFPRNIYRGERRCFDYDSLARDWCRSGLDAGMDRQLVPIRRVFFYLPLEHSEDSAHQSDCLSLFGQLLKEVPEAEKELFQGYSKYAQQHWDIIERFGRYPHRNELLGRECTPEELDFLKQPGSSF